MPDPRQHYLSYTRRRDATQGFWRSDQDRRDSLYEGPRAWYLDSICPECGRGWLRDTLQNARYHVALFERGAPAPYRDQQLAWWREAERRIVAALQERKEVVR
uniref:Uncharacterized protein n=1 Tax=viral metagenome TaxID=1070528 RepID=A0A6M3JND9_9ZZZZ